jgi:hypothetical protein
MGQRFPVGTVFVRRGQDYREVVLDYHVTTNLAGEVVKARYLCGHDYLGQVVLDHDITDTSIARATVLVLPEQQAELLAAIADEELVAKNVARITAGYLATGQPRAREAIELWVGKTSLNTAQVTAVICCIAEEWERAAA